MSHGEDTTPIISLDLTTHEDDTLDVTHDFPYSELHPISLLRPYIDSLDVTQRKEIDLHTPQTTRMKEEYSLSTLDLGHSDLSKKRGLTRHDAIGHDPYTIDLFPPLPEILSALDIRAGEVKSKRKYSDLFTRSLPASLHVRRFAKDMSRIIRKYQRPVIGILLIIIGCSLPVLLYVEKLTKGAYDHLGHIREAGGLMEVQEDVRSAKAKFERANILFAPYRLVPIEKIHLARTAIDGGLALSRGIDRLLATADASESGSLLTQTRDPSDSLYRPTPTDIHPLALLGIGEPSTWLKNERDNIIYLRTELSKAGTIYANIGDISDPRGKEIAHIGRGIEKMVSIIDFYLSHESDLLTLIGADEPQRYMVLNQNRDEIRANGGFPGSVITFSMYQGNISDYRTDDVYYYDWNLYPYKEVPPPGLALITGNYGLRDVNYYPDFRETLDKANSFIERSGDQTVTIGLAIHQGLIEDILRDIGGVKLAGVDEPFTSENFSLLMSILVESRYGEVTSAKDILGEFVQAFVARIHEKRAYEEVFSHLENALKSGEILFASRDTDIDAFLSHWRKPLPWADKPTQQATTGSGKVTTSGETLFDRVSGFLGQDRTLRSIDTVTWSFPQIGSNWVYPVLTSLSGNKSDRIIERDYKATTEKTGACTVENTLVFTHKHLYTTSYEDKILLYLRLIGVTDPTLRDKLLTIQGRGNNKTFMRVLVPIASKLSGSVAGIDETATPEYREFAFTLDTPIGGTASKTIRYTTTLPRCNEVSRVDWYQQPGLTRTHFESR